VLVSLWHLQFDSCRCDEARSAQGVVRIDVARPFLGYGSETHVLISTRLHSNDFLSGIGYPIIIATSLLVESKRDSRLRYLIHRGGRLKTEPLGRRVIKDG
jgi:hypothetical protein